MPLSDYEKYREMSAEADKECDIKTRRQMKKAAARYLDLDLHKSKPTYGIRSIVLFTLCVIVVIFAVLSAIWIFLPWEKASGVTLGGCLVLFLIYVFSFRGTHHITGEEMKESLKVGFDGFKGIADSLGVLKGERPSKRPKEMQAGSMKSIAAEEAADSTADSSKAPRIEF